jgi:CubicO group peptidase (beta-lactamase class C family)
VLNTLITRKAELNNIAPPNKHFEYCNTNFALLGLLIEKLSGQKLPVFLRDTFFIPLQMKNTFVYTDADSAQTTPSYDWRSKMYPFGDLDKVYGDKNVFTTPRDLLIWDRALTSGKIFTQQTLEAAYKPYSNERAGIKNYGLGWHMYVFPNGKKIIYHNGWWHGSNAVFTRLIQDSATVIVIGNKFNHNIYKAKDLSNIFGNYGGGDDDEPENSAEQNSTSAAVTNPGIPKRIARRVGHRRIVVKKKRRMRRAS